MNREQKKDSKQRWDLEKQTKSTGSLMSEQKLIEKLRLVEALFAGAATSGEKVAVVPLLLKPCHKKQVSEDSEKT